MKKNIVLFVSLIFVLVGCAISNTPTSKVEDLFNNYASNDVILSNKPTIKYPTLIIFKNGKIINVYNEKIPNLYSVKIFLMTNGVEIND